MALQIVTALWGNKYSEDYVLALKRQVRGIKVMRVGNGLLEPHKFTGWWCKLELFRPENAHMRPCLFIDLDTFIFGSLAPFFKLDDTKFWMIRQFKDLRSPSTKERSNSGLMIAPKNVDHIWNIAKSIDFDHGNRGKGDGEFLAQFPHEILQDHVSGIMSYKCDRLEKKKPDDARVVCFHGRPHPHEAEGWALDWWNKCTKP